MVSVTALERDAGDEDADSEHEVVELMPGPCSHYRSSRIVVRGLLSACRRVTNRPVMAERYTMRRTTRRQRSKAI